MPSRRRISGLPQPAKLRIPSRNLDNGVLDRIHRTPQVSIGEVFYKAGGQVGPRIQDRFELTLVFEGTAEFHVDSLIQKISHNEVMLLKPGHHETFYISPELPYHQAWCIARKEVIPASLMTRLVEIPLGFKVEASKEFNELIELALEVKTRNAVVDVAFYEHLALAIFFEFARIAEPGIGNGMIYPDGLLRALRFIEGNFHRPINLEEIAHESGVARHYLIKLFQRFLETSPINYLWNLRIQKGAELLRSSGMNVSEIADVIGFLSPFHFSRLFKKKHGVSPKGFRERMWKTSELTIIKENERKKPSRARK